MQSVPITTKVRITLMTRCSGNNIYWNLCWFNVYKLNICISRTQSWTKWCSVWASCTAHSHLVSNLY